MPGRVPRGASVGGYVVEGLAGVGGMGVVYRATDPGLGRAVALKLIAPAFAEDAARRELFVRESLAAAGLEHPNVIPVYRAGEDDGRLFIAMRFVEGASLQELVRASGGLPAGRAARIVARVGEALDAAHSRGLVHRDVKPANILVSDPDGEEHVYLTDFGVSIHGAGAAAGAAGGWTGTRDYLAPEQIRGGPLDGRTDVYALGCTLFHALTGRPPFATGDERATLVAHLTQPPPAPSSLVPGLPPAMDAVVRRAMAKRPEDRFATAGELGRAALAARHDAAVLHDPADADAARAVAAALVEAGVEATLAPGDAAGAADAVRASGACAVLVGRGGLGAWAGEGVAAAADLAGRDRAFRRVTVLLPGAPDADDPGLAALGGTPWIDLRAGVADPLAIEDLARSLGGGAAAAGGAPGEECPYRGLEAFGEEDAGLFFGRERDVERLLHHLGSSRFVAVVGPSGAGKSSLVHAGLVPAVRGGPPGGAPWRVLTLTPGAHPVAALAAALARLPGAGSPSPATLAADPDALEAAVARACEGRPEGERVLIVVDQLEEAFTLCDDAAARAAALDALARAATGPSGRAVVVATIRADFYGRLTEHAGVAALVVAHQVLVGPLDEAGLRRAIEEPARAAGLELEPGLVRRILADVGDRAGALPLLEHLLVELWRRRRGRTLTLEAYAASGGVEGALARRANDVYGAMDPGRQAVARRVLLRLTAPGEGTEDTRRRATRRELVTGPADAPEVDAVVGALAEARLLTTGTDEATGEPVVEVTHEALIRGWPELRRWIDDDRERLREQRRLADAAAEWRAAGGEDPGLLMRGARLAGWRERGREGLNPDEVAFLDASAAHEERERGARRRRVRIAIGALAAAVVLVGGVAAYAFVQRDDAAEQRDLAESREVAANARLQLDSDPELSLLLAQEALAIADTPDAEAAVRQAAHESRVRAALRGPAAVLDASYAPDGETVWLGDAAGTVRVWPPAGGPVRTFDTGQGEVRTVEVTPDGATVATAGEDGTVRLWDPSGAPVRTLEGHEGPVNELAITPDGATLVSAGEDGTVRVWPVAGGRARVLRADDGPVVAVAVDPTGRRVVSGAVDGTVRIRSLDGGAGPVLETQALVISVAISPDGRRVAIGDGARSVRLWTPARPAARVPVLLASQVGGVDATAFSPDGDHLVTGGSDGTVRIWDADGAPVTTLRGHENEMRSVAFSADGRSVLSAGDDGSARIWAWDELLPAAQTLGPADFPADGGAEFAPDGRSLFSIGLDGSLRTWDLRAAEMAEVDPGGVEGGYVVSAAVSDDGSRYAIVRPDGAVEVSPTAGGGEPVVLPAQGGATVGAVDLSADGARVLTGGSDGSVRLWDVDAGTAEEIGAGQGEVYAADLSADGTVAATGGSEGVVRVWDVPGRAEVAALAGHEGDILALEVDATGERVVSGGVDRTVRLWDVASGEGRVLLGHQGETFAAFGAGGSRVISTSNDGVRVWDAETGGQLLLVPSPAREAYRAALSPDGATIALQTFTASILLYPCSTCGSADAALELAEDRVTRELTPAERSEFGLD